LLLKKQEKSNSEINHSKECHWRQLMHAATNLAKRKKEKLKVNIPMKFYALPSKQLHGEHLKLGEGGEGIRENLNHNPDYPGHGGRTGLILFDPAFTKFTVQAHKFVRITLLILLGTNMELNQILYRLCNMCTM
jgi:hypothetical protein